MNEAFVAIRNVAKTRTQDTTTTESLKLVLVEKNGKLRNGKESILLGGTESVPAPRANRSEKHHVPHCVE